jgi:vacuolar-type H+-ATPase subunit E/Vma4
VRSSQSNHVRAARLSILAEREQQLQNIKEDAKKRLARLVQSDKYSSLLESLIVEVRAWVELRLGRSRSGRACSAVSQAVHDAPAGIATAALPSADSPGMSTAHLIAAIHGHTSPRARRLTCLRSRVRSRASPRAVRASQGLIRLEGTVVSVRGVNGQATLVKNVLPGAVTKYKAWAEKEKGAAFVKEIDVTFAPDIPVKGSCGGVVIATAGDKIILDNTLETRLDLAMQVRLPETRRVLFG